MPPLAKRFPVLMEEETVLALRQIIIKLCRHPIITFTPQHRETVKPSYGSAVTAELHKTSFYLTQAQLDKLDELAYAYKRHTGKRINRNDIMRFLVDHARLETLLAEW